MSWTCPECGKVLKNRGSHMSTHIEPVIEVEAPVVETKVLEEPKSETEEPDFLLVEEDIIDNGKIAVKLTVDPVSSDVINEEVCKCTEDSVNIDCEEHKWLRACVYCNAAGVITVDESMPSVIEYRCVICGKTYKVNTVAKVVAWKTE